jgi:hypothetical protein
MPKHKFIQGPAFPEGLVVRLIRILDGAERSIKICTGEAPPEIFDEPGFMNAIRKRSAVGVRIEIVAGPVILKGEDEYSPAIIGWAKDNAVKLYLRKTRGEGNHFWIVDDEIVYLENQHSPLTPIDLITPQKTIRKKFNPRGFFVHEMNFKRQTMPDDLYPHSNERLLLLKASDLKVVIEEAKNRGDKYDAMDKHQIEELLKYALENYKKWVEEFAAIKHQLGETAQ